MCALQCSVSASEVTPPVRMTRRCGRYRGQHSVWRRVHEPCNTESPAPGCELKVSCRSLRFGEERVKQSGPQRAGEVGHDKAVHTFCDDKGGDGLSPLGVALSNHTNFPNPRVGEQALLDLHTKTKGNRVSDGEGSLAVEFREGEDEEVR